MPESDLVIVDDIAENLSILSTILEKEGYRVRPAISGALALQAIEIQLPDLILLDIRMPGMDGFEVCKRLKANEQTKNIPVIFVSALNEIEDKVKAFSVGGVDYITKPFQSDEVSIRIQTHIILAEQRKHIENLNRVQSQMIDLVTHNIRTPLATILLNSEMIQRAKPENIDRYAKKINRAGEHINTLVSDFFNLNRLDSGETLKIQAIDITEFIMGIIERFVASAQHSQIELQSELPEDPIIFHSDFHYLEEALNNLVSNAIKYTSAGGTVIVRAFQREAEIIIELQDNGSGINPESLSDIFDRFYRLPAHRKAGIPGTGLGLSITRSIIERLGGEIIVESQLGEGSIFQVLLPHVSPNTQSLQ